MKRREACARDIEHLESGDHTGISFEGLSPGPNQIQKLLRLKRATLAHIDVEIEELARVNN